MGFFSWLKARIADAVVQGVEEGVARLNSADAGPPALQLTLALPAPPAAAPAGNGHAQPGRRAARGRGD